MPLKRLFKSMTDQRALDQNHDLRQSIKRYEARVGGTLFGPVPKGHRREFFCLDRHTWVWYEEWKDEAGKARSMTTRYDVRPNGVVKIQDGHPSSYVSEEEGRNLYRAVRQYNQRLDADYARFV